MYRFFFVFSRNIQPEMDHSFVPYGLSPRYKGVRQEISPRYGRVQEEISPRYKGIQTEISPRYRGISEETSPMYRRVDVPPISLQGKGLSFPLRVCDFRFSVSSIATSNTLRVHWAWRMKLNSHFEISYMTILICSTLNLFNTIWTGGRSYWPTIRFQNASRKK